MKKIEITCLAFFRVKGRLKKSIYQAKMNSIIDEWRAIAAYHTAALAQAEAKIAELSASGAPPPAVAAPPVELHLSPTEFKHLVIQMGANDAKKAKAGWNKLIARGLIQNVQGILEDCYDSLRLKDSNPEGWKAARELGARGSVKWQKFTLRVIQHLKAEGSFGVGTEYENDFEDTAGGCDEITWNAACHLLAAARGEAV